MTLYQNMLETGLIVGGWDKYEGEASIQCLLVEQFCSYHLQLEAGCSSLTFLFPCSYAEYSFVTCSIEVGGISFRFFSIYHEIFRGYERYILLSS